jgi:hypothetical protein
MRRLSLLLIAGTFALTSSVANAREACRAAADNAALRYWMAFAQMNDSPISKEETAKLDAVLAGNSPWDEQQFGALIEQNKEALDTMIRGTRLPYCDWGIEADLGPDAPVAHLPKARALARLNVLYAERLASTGDYDSAVQTISAGIRFAQHLAQNASFFGALTAKTALTAHLQEVKRLADSGRLSSTQLASLRGTLKRLPLAGFDWPNAARLEGSGMGTALESLSRSSDPRALYQTWFGAPVPADFRVPAAKDISELDRAIALYAKLLEMPPDAARVHVPNLQKQIASLDPVSQMLVPNPARMVAARAELISAQQQAEDALATR